jgi:hypothetical protein
MSTDDTASVEPSASVDDVRVLIDTTLSDDDIEPILERAARSTARNYDDGDFDDEYHRADYEATLAAYWIAGGRDRRVSSKRAADLQIDYDGDALDILREQLNELDPDEDDGAERGVVRNSDRHVRSANN